MKDLLDILIFTYNRAEFLARTLEQFAASPFKNCRFTILDNHSTDSTPEVCLGFQARFAQMRVIRHPKNIGGLANLLRAIEVAGAKFTWIICDDDSYDFSAIDDVLDVLRDGGADLVSIGVEGHELPSGARTQIRGFALEHPYLLGHSFVPALIFRTNLFTPELIRAGYDNIDTMFPHFPFLAAVARGESVIYVSRSKVIRKSSNVGYSTFRFLSGWAKSCRKIGDTALRCKGMKEVFGREVLLKNLLYCILTERRFRPAACAREYSELLKQLLLASPAVAAVASGFAPLVFAPGFIFEWLWEKYQAHRKTQGQAVPVFDEHR